MSESDKILMKVEANVMSTLAVPVGKPFIAKGKLEPERNSARKERKAEVLKKCEGLKVVKK